MFLHSRTYWAMLSALVLLFIIPVAFGAGYFQLPKLALLGSGVTLAGISAFLNRKRLQATLPRPVIYLLLAYLCWILLTNTVWSSAPAYTLLGWREWYGGFFMQAMFVLVILLASIRPRAQQVDASEATPASPAWLYVFLGLTLLLVVVAVLELLGFNPILGSGWFRWNGAGINAPSSGQPVATVGNSGWFAGVWLLLAPLPLLLQARSPLWTLVWQLAIAIGVSMVHSKITIIAYLIFQLGLIIYFLVLRINKLSFLIIPVICAAISLISFPAAIKVNGYLYNSGVVTRLSNAKLLDSRMNQSSTTARLINYRVALRLISQRPIKGWGSETFHEFFFDELTQDEYRQYISPVVNLKHDEDVRHFGTMHMVTAKKKPGVIKSLTYFEVVKPHNFILEELYSNGIIGFLLISAAIIILCSHILLRRSPEGVVLLSSLGLYALFLMLWFTGIAVTPIACAFLAYAARSAARLTE